MVSRIVYTMKLSVKFSLIAVWIILFILILLIVLSFLIDCYSNIVDYKRFMHILINMEFDCKFNMAFLILTQYGSRYKNL